MRPRTRSRTASDRGSATVWTVGAIAVLCVVFGTVLVMGQAVVVRHRAGGAADLAALAAADHWMDGRTEACARAGRVARAQDTRIVRCAVDGDISDVTVAAGRGPLTAEVRSRAGPAGTGGPGPGLAEAEAEARPWLTPTAVP
nr:Rv3654c family TadE-like protein [Streptomyces sp. V3I8]